jgi:enoyl-CoA hydratase/carnithine racemase
MPTFEGKPANSFQFKEIIYEKKNWVATVTINRPEAYNAYTTLTLQEMARAFQDASYDDSVAVVVLTGAGEKAFCTGGDVKEYAGDYTARPRDYWKWGNLFLDCHNRLRNIGKPTIARLNGIVAGGGNEFNLSCDLAIAADHVTIRQVGTRVGSVAAGGATQLRCGAKGLPTEFAYCGQCGNKLEG